MDILATKPTPDEFMRMCAAAFFAVMLLGSLVSVVGNRIHRAYCRLRKRSVPADAYGARVRLAGGFATLLFASIVNQWFVSAAAVIIGGLLIAPERFLLVLTAILRSNGKHAADIALGVIKMKPGEIRDKWDEDASDAEDDDNDKTPPRGQGPSPSGGVRERAVRIPQAQPRSTAVNKVMHIEEDVLSLIKDLSSYSIEPYSTISRRGMNYGYDAVAVDYESGEVRTAIEIKYQQRLERRRVSDFVRKIKSTLPAEYSLLLIFVVESYSARDLEMFLQLRGDALKTKHNIGISLFTYADDLLTPIDDEDLRRLI